MVTDFRAGKVEFKEPAKGGVPRSAKHSSTSKPWNISRTQTLGTSGSREERWGQKQESWCTVCIKSTWVSRSLPIQHNLVANKRESGFVCLHKGWKKVWRCGLWESWSLGPIAPNLLAFPAWTHDGFISSKHRALIQGRRKGEKEDSSPHCSCPLLSGEEMLS